LGEGAVVPFEQQNMGAEDFAYFVGADTGVPGYYFAVGGTTPERIAAAKAGGPPIAGHHSPLFQIAPRESITVGARAMVAAVLDLAGKKK
jgi:hippurate hydrolase